MFGQSDKFNQMTTQAAVNYYSHPANFPHIPHDPHLLPPPDPQYTVQKVFLDITSTPFRYKFKALIGAIKKVSLLAYSIKGAPTTLGTPDNLFLNVEFTNLPMKAERSDQLSSIPLPIEGPFTSHTLTQPTIVSEGLIKGMQELDVTLTNPDGSTGSFTEVCLWLDFYCQK